ncbi:MAG: hypothetical protein LBJ69_02635 [Holosporales bacterium]|nr:hypothetical protein [Holosporales bacterium]
MKMKIMTIVATVTCALLLQQSATATCPSCQSATSFEDDLARLRQDLNKIITPKAQIGSHASVSESEINTLSEEYTGQATGTGTLGQSLEKSVAIIRQYVAQTAPGDVLQVTYPNCQGDDILADRRLDPVTERIFYISQEAIASVGQYAINSKMIANMIKLSPTPQYLDLIAYLNAEQQAEI